MLAPTLWAAALLPALAIAAPSPSPLANPYEVETTYTDEPTDTTLPGIYFGKKLTLGPQADYLGVYGSGADPMHIYRQEEPELLERFSADELYAPGGPHMVWIGLAGVEGLTDDAVADAFRELDEDRMAAKIAAYLASLAAEPAADAYAAGSSSEGQAPLSSSNVGRPALTHADLAFTNVWFSGQGRAGSTAIVYMPDAMLPVLDLFLPAILVPVVVPKTALQETVPEERIKYLENVTEHIKFSPEVDTIVQSLSIKQLEKDVAYLTGEDPSSPILSRHSFSSGAVVAAQWLKAEVEATGANCTLEAFLAGFAPNVICHYPVVGGHDKDVERVIISGHYDSRGSFGSTRAPGGDDDASGSGSVLAIARAIKAAGIRGFKHQATLAFFAGEEQGLLGSHAYAQKLFQSNATVLIQVQSDMLAYHDEGETLQLGFPDLIGAPAAADLLRKFAAIYSPELVIGTSPACCSDHQSFHGFGFPATQVFERNGGIIDPMYHNTGDVSRRSGFDFDQVKSIAKVTFATLLEVAQFVV